MTTWQDLASTNMTAAKLLHEKGKARPSITRSYYAAYCALTERLRARHQQEFKRDGNNPSHEQLWELTCNNLQLRKVPQADRLRRSIGSKLRTLRSMRIVAEYVPGQMVDLRDSLEAFQLASAILRDLETTA